MFAVTLRVLWSTTAAFQTIPNTDLPGAGSSSVLLHTTVFRIRAWLKRVRMVTLHFNQVTCDLNMPQQANRLSYALTGAQEGHQ